MQAKITSELQRAAKLKVPAIFPEAAAKKFEPLPDNFLRDLRQKFSLEEVRKRVKEIEVLPPDWMCWVLNPVGATKFFLVLGICEDDSFTLDVGWSKRGKLPRSRIVMPDEAREENEVLFRLAWFWGAQGYDQCWYLGRRRTPLDIIAGAPDDPLDMKLADIEPKLDEALGMVRKYAVPYLLSMAQRHGTMLPINPGGTTHQLPK